MEIFAAVGGGAFVVVSLVLGTRLLLMAQRTRKLPELCMGACLLLMGGVGYPLIAVVQQATQVAPELRAGVLVAQMLCHVVGNLGLAVFTMRVFRPEATWSRAATVAIIGATVALAIAQTFGEGLVAFALHGTGAWRFHSAVALVNLSWAGVESMRYHLQLERRLRLGLADPVVSDRLRLWALGMLSAASITLIDMMLVETHGGGLATTPLGGLVLGLLGTTASAAIWLAFLPPRAYTSWVAARAA